MRALRKRSAYTGLMSRSPPPEATDHISGPRSTSIEVTSAVLTGLGKLGQYMADSATLCQIAGVSERSLQTAFNDVYGEPPSVHLRRRALHTARRVLEGSDAGRTTVTAVAHDHGFTHLGRFARYYKEHFGESPSDTLRRDPDPATPSSSHAPFPVKQKALDFES